MKTIGLETQNRVEKTYFTPTLIHGHFNQQPAIGLNSVQWRAVGIVNRYYFLTLFYSSVEKSISGASVVLPARLNMVPDFI